MYAKIVNGYLQPAPREFIENNKRIIGFTDEFLRKRGYKPVVFTDPPSETAMPVYTETEDNIVQSWTEQ
jgi:hypothetical protein